jgi:hypothetical protein
VDNVTGCVDVGSEGATTLCPVASGGTRYITIAGAHFGSVGADLDVRVANRSCESVEILTPDRELRCLLPDTSGPCYNLSVTVTFAGRTGFRYALSYAGPKINPQSLRFNPGSVNIVGGVSRLTIGTMTGGQSVIFQGAFFGNDPSPAVIQGVSAAAVLGRRLAC